MNSHDVGSSSSSSAKGHAPFHRQTSHPMAARHDKKVSRLHSVESRSQQKGADIIDLTSDGDDLTLVPASTWFGKKSKRIPSPNLGFLIQVRKSPKNPYYPLLTTSWILSKSLSPLNTYENILKGSVSLIRKLKLELKLSTISRAGRPLDDRCLWCQFLTLYN